MIFRAFLVQYASLALKPDLSAVKTETFEEIPRCCLSEMYA